MEPRALGEVPQDEGLGLGWMTDYYDIEPGMTIPDIIDRWAGPERGKAYDRSMPVWYEPEALWPYREYTWTRERARRPLFGPDVTGPEKWDTLVESLREHGWDERNPAIVDVGRNGVAKVGEGNHRLAIARKLGILVPVRFVFSQKVYVDPKLREDPTYQRPRKKPKPRPRTPPRRTKPLTPEEEAEIAELMELLGQR